MKYTLGIVALGVFGFIVFWYTQTGMNKDMTQDTNLIEVENTNTNNDKPQAQEEKIVPILNTNSSVSAPATSVVPTTPIAPKVSTKPLLTMVEVAKHADTTSCYSAINGNVYDLTLWIGKHPGGERAIKGICGVDGSDGFNGKHGGQPQPASAIAKYLLGSLVR